MAYRIKDYKHQAREVHIKFKILSAILYFLLMIFFLRKRIYVYITAILAITNVNMLEVTNIYNNIYRNIKKVQNGSNKLKNEEKMYFQDVDKNRNCVKKNPYPL